MAQRVKGRGNIRTAAVLFLVSAVFEIMEFNSAVALFGGVRTGAVSGAYHLVFAAVYTLSGIGMWTAKPWGYSAFMTTTAIYTVDKIQLILFRDAFYDYILQQLTVTRDIVGMLPKGGTHSVFYDSLYRPSSLLVGICALHSHAAAIFSGKPLVLSSDLRVQGVEGSRGRGVEGSTILDTGSSMLESESMPRVVSTAEP